MKKIVEIIMLRRIWWVVYCLLSLLFFLVLPLPFLQKASFQIVLLYAIPLGVLVGTVVVLLIHAIGAIIRRHKKFLRVAAIPAHRPLIITLPKAVMLGTYPSIDDLKLALHEDNYQVAEHAANIFKTISLSSRQMEIELVSRTPHELGFTGHDSYPTTAEIFTRAKELGYDQLPAEAGPQLRLQWPDQPSEYDGTDEDKVCIAMKPIDDDGFPLVFTLEHNYGYMWLHVHAVDRDRDHDYFWHSRRWIFTPHRES